MADVEPDTQDGHVHRLDRPDVYHRRLTQPLSNQMDAALAARRRLIEMAYDAITWPLMMAMSTTSTCRSRCLHVPTEAIGDTPNQHRRDVGFATPARQ